MQVSLRARAESVLGAGTRVNAHPFGLGRVISFRESDDMYEVEMVAWAAFGFFHRGSLTVLRDARRRRLSMTAGSTRSVGDGRMVDIEVHGATGITDVQWIARQDPYLVVVVMPSGGETQHFVSTLARWSGHTAPRWDTSLRNTLELPLHAGDDLLSLQLWNENWLLEDDLIGIATCRLAALGFVPEVKEAESDAEEAAARRAEALGATAFVGVPVRSGERARFPLSTGGAIDATLTMTLDPTLLHGATPRSVAGASSSSSSSSSSRGTGDGYGAGQRARDLAAGMQGAVLRRLLAVDVAGAADLYDCNWVGAMEPYVVVTPLPSRREARKTLPSLGGGTNPRWGAEQGAVAMELRLAAADTALLLEVFNEALIGADSLLGQCEVPLPPGVGTGGGGGGSEGGGAEWAAGQTVAAGPAELSTAWGTKQGELLFTVRERGAASLVLAPPTTHQPRSSPGKPPMPNHTPQPPGSSEAQARVSLPQAQEQRQLRTAGQRVSALRRGDETHPRLLQIAPHSVQQASAEGQDDDTATGLLPATPPNGSVHRSDAAAECATPPPEERPASEAAGAFAAALAEAVERSETPPDHEGQCSESADAAAAAPRNRRTSRDVAGRSFEGDVPDAGAPSRLKADIHPRFGKYRMMKKCKLPDGAIRQKMENDEMSEADIAIFLGADAAPAPAPAPAALRPKPAAAAPKLAAAAAKKASQAKFLKRGLQATPFGGGGGGGGRPENPFGGSGGSGKMDLLAAIQAKGGASGGGLKKVEAGAGVAANKPKPASKGGAPAPMSMMEEMMAKQRAMKK